MNEPPEQAYGMQLQNPMMPVSQQGDDNTFMQLMGKNDSLKLLKEYLIDEGIPSEAKIPYWATHSKHLAISFMTPIDAEVTRIRNHLTQLTEIMSKPPQAYTWEMMMRHEQQNIKLDIDITRSIGTDRTRTNERTLQNTQLIGSFQEVNNKNGSSGGGVITKAFRSIFG